MGVAQKNPATAHANGKRSASIPPTAVAFLEAPTRTMLPMVIGRLFVFFTLNGLPRFAQPAVQLKQASVISGMTVAVFPTILMTCPFSCMVTGLCYDSSFIRALHSA